MVTEKVVNERRNLTGEPDILFYFPLPPPRSLIRLPECTGRLPKFKLPPSRRRLKKARGDSGSPPSAVTVLLRSVLFSSESSTRPPPRLDLPRDAIHLCASWPRLRRRTSRLCASRRSS